MNKSSTVSLLVTTLYWRRLQMRMRETDEDAAMKARDFFAAIGYRQDVDKHRAVIQTLNALLDNWCAEFGYVRVIGNGFSLWCTPPKKGKRPPIDL